MHNYALALPTGLGIAVAAALGLAKVAIVKVTEGHSGCYHLCYAQSPKAIPSRPVRATLPSFTDVGVGAGRWGWRVGNNCKCLKLPWCHCLHKHLCPQAKVSIYMKTCFSLTRNLFLWLLEGSLPWSLHMMISLIWIDLYLAFCP